MLRSLISSFNFRCNKNIFKQLKEFLFAVVFGHDRIDSITNLSYTTGRFAILLYLPAVDQCLGAPVGFHWLHLMSHDAPAGFNFDDTR